MAKKRDFTPNQLDNLRVAVSLREESAADNDDRADETMWRKLREKIESMMAYEENPRACALPGTLSTKDRDKLPAKAFGLPKERKYPMYTMSGGKLIPSGSHAANAKARAQAEFDNGRLSKKNLMQIDRKANKVLATCGTKGKKRNPYLSEEDVLTEIVLTAVNDGDAYRDNRNARAAVERAIREYLRRTAEDARETLDMVKRQAIREVKKQWGDPTREANPNTGSSTALVGRLKF